MATFKEKDVIKSLKKKGFVKTKKGKHKFFNFKYNNKITSINTHFSNNGQEIDDGLISLMAKQVYLTNSQFKDLVNCPLSEADYIEILIGKGILKT